MVLHSFTLKLLTVDLTITSKLTTRFQHCFSMSIVNLTKPSILYSINFFGETNQALYV